MIKNGRVFKAGKVTEWLDCGNVESSINSNQKMLDFHKIDKIPLVSSDVKLVNSKIIDPVYVLTSCGPGTATETSSFYIFIKGLREFQFGYSAALSFTYLIIMIISLTIIAKVLVRLMIRDN